MADEILRLINDMGKIPKDLKIKLRPGLRAVGQIVRDQSRLNSRLLLDFDADYTSPLDLSTTENNLGFTRQINLASGVGAGQADKIWHDNRTLTASSTEDLDLAGVLVDAFGATLTFARIKGLIVYASPANTNNVVVGNSASGIVGWFGANTHS